MNHLDIYQLNEYLDGQLEKSERQAVETHLAACADCRAELANLQAVFLALDEVDEVVLAADLSARVLADWRTQSTPEPTFWLRPLLALQLAGAIGMLVWLWPVIGAWLMRLETAVAAFPPIQFDWGQQVIVWGTAVTQQLQSARPAIDLGTSQWALLIGLALITWLVGNKFLLTND